MCLRLAVGTWRPVAVGGLPMTQPQARVATRFHSVPAITLALAAFTASACLFAIELFAGKRLLPIFGGAPAVWVTCLAFFQVLLVTAYAFAHRLTRASPRGQIITVASLFVTAIIATAALDRARIFESPPDDVPLSVAVLVALAAFVGPAFFTVATLSPIYGHWASLAGCRRGRQSSSPAIDAYALYAAGNAGSFMVLLLYPLVLEPAWGLRLQAAAVATLFGAVAVLSLAAGWQLLPTEQTSAEAPAEVLAVRSVWLRWAAIAAIPASWLSSVTTHATVEIAPLPLLWVVPLAVYIGSFVLVFSRYGRSLRRYEPEALRAALLLVTVLVGCGVEQPVPFVITAHVAAFFVVCVGLHGMLFDERPQPNELTKFYLALACGGAFGGLFNGLVAPLVCDAHHEFPLVIAATATVIPNLPVPPTVRTMGMYGVGWLAVLAVALLSGWLPSTATNCLWLVAVAGATLFWARGPWRGIAVAVSLLAAFYLAESQAGVIHRTRTFFGVLRVTTSDNGPSRTLRHGNIAHGEQLVSEDLARRAIPLMYYHPSGPLGSVFATLDGAGRLRNVGVAGLGIGSIAAYAKPGQRFTFFEIDPEIVRIASDPCWFTHLADCQGEFGIVIDDARLAIARQPDHTFDLLVIDVFTGDAVPTHLLTREAIALYGRKVVADGAIALHISNRYLDFVPLVESLALAEGWMALDGHDADPAPGVARAGSHWTVLSRSLSVIKAIHANPTSDSWRWVPLGGPPRMAPWTDDWAPVTTCLRR